MSVYEWDFDKFDGIKVDMLCENSSTKEIRIAMQDGSFMKEHSAPHEIMVQVLSGEIDFDLPNKGEKIRLKKLDMIALSAAEPHSLYAIKDSIIRLSISKLDSVSRVFGVLRS